MYHGYMISRNRSTHDADLWPRVLLIRDARAEDSEFTSINPARLIGTTQPMTETSCRFSTPCSDGHLPTEYSTPRTQHKSATTRRKKMLISQTEPTKDGNRGEMEMEEGEDRDGTKIWGASSSTRRDRYAVCGGRDWRLTECLQLTLALSHWWHHLRNSA
ncbi:hypothetical protein BC826DRAFT_626971 [Russula brevipes]|nr:hypothetical protein BC826DRAFT_626971 [Russula brevipes]